MKWFKVTFSRKSRETEQTEVFGLRPFFNVAWGNAPGTKATTRFLAEGHIHHYPGVNRQEGDNSMPQSLTQLYAHLIFSTKNRKPFLDDDIRPRVHAYLATIIRDLDSPYVVVGGVADHVHILFDMGKMHAPVEFVENVKRESSKFVKTLGKQYKEFYWQRGYGVFSVSPTHKSDAEAYVRNQEEHHRTKTFQEEYREFLKRYGVEFNEEYVWD
jgi:putative transposase